MPFAFALEDATSPPSSPSFLGVVRLGTLRLVDRGNRLSWSSPVQGSNLNALRQFQIAQVNNLVHLYFVQVYFDELGQVLRQTDNFNFSHGVGNNTTLQFHGRSNIFVDEVQRYVNVDLVILVNAQEVGVGQQGLYG